MATADLIVEPTEGHTYRNEAEKLRDLETISSMYLRGMKADEIARELATQYNYPGLTAEAVRLDLVKLREMWVHSALIKYDEAKAREIAHIDELEAEAWAAWKKSWGEVTTIVQEGIEDRWGHQEDTIKEVNKTPSTYTRQRGTKKTTSLVGDPRYLDTIKWCIEQRCKILGLHEPMRLAITWRDEAAKAGLTDDEIERIYGFAQRAITKGLRDKLISDNTLDIPEVPQEESFLDEDNNDGT